MPMKASSFGLAALVSRQRKDLRHHYDRERIPGVLPRPAAPGSSARANPDYGCVEWFIYEDTSDARRERL